MELSFRVVLGLDRFILICIIFTVIIFYAVKSWFTNSKKRTQSLELTYVHISDILFNDRVNSDESQCTRIYYHSGTTCNKRRSQTCKEKAVQLRDDIKKSQPLNTALGELLQNYAKSCLCGNHRKIMNGSPSFWNDQVTRWVKEIETMFISDVHDVLDVFKDVMGYEAREKVEQEVMDCLNISAYQRISPLPGSFPNSQSTIDEGGGTSRWSELALDVIGAIQQRFRDRFECDDSAQHKCEEADFTMYPPRGTLHELVKKSLRETEKTRGWVYIYRCCTENGTDNSRHLKIGCTTLSPEHRLNTWWYKCGQRPRILKQFATNNAVRAERLIHKELELRGLRRYNNRCRNDQTRCKTKHNEWFEIQPQDASAVAEYWTSWMKKHEPYDQKGLKFEMYPDNYAANEVFLSSIEETENVMGDFLRDSRGQPWWTQKPAKTTYQHLANNVRQNIDRKSVVEPKFKFPTYQSRLCYKPIAQVT